MQERIPVIVGFKEKPDVGLVKAFGGSIKYQYSIIPAVSCLLPKNAAEFLKKNPRIAYVELDGKVKVLGEVLPWGVDRIDAEQVWDSNGDLIVDEGANAGEAVKVAIIDTGVDYNHPDLAGNVKGGASFVDYTSNYMDDNGHGTHVAGIIAAVDNEVGVIGVAPKIELYALKALDSEGSGYVSDVVAAIDWAVENGMQIVSMSLGANNDYKSLRQACDAAYASGVLLVAAAGNDASRFTVIFGIDTIDYPARYDSVVAVGAINQEDERPSWSSTGPELELAAPGVDIYSTYWDNTYAALSGTSMACPHVSGVAALIFASNIGEIAPSYDFDGDKIWDADEVRAWLQATAEDLGNPGKDEFYGYGLVDAEKAVPKPADSKPPSKVTGLTVSAVSESQLNLSWNPATDNVAVDHYNIYRSTTSGFTPSQENLIATSTTTSYSDTGLTALTTYYYRVSAVDTAGNEGPFSDEASGKTLADKTGPNTLNLNINPNPTNEATTVTLTATIDDSTNGNSNIVAAEYFIGEIGGDGSGIPMEASDGIFNSSVEDVAANIDVSGWSAGSYTIYVHGKDAAGNWGSISSVILEVTEAPPQPTAYTIIDMSRMDIGRGVWSWSKATAAVTVLENGANGSPIEGATVYGYWSGAVSKDVSGVTNAEGKVVFETRYVRNAGTFTFTIDKIEKDGVTFNLTGETSDSI